MSRGSMSDVEHVIRVEATWQMAADVTVGLAEYLTNDGEYRNIYGTRHHREGVELDFVAETKRTYECRCGRRFRKGKTAREHLEQSVGRDSNSTGGEQ